MDQPETEPEIDEVIDSFSERLERGECPSIQEYKDRYPGLAAQIDAALPALIVLNRVDQKPDRKLAFDDSIPEIIGDYQIIQEVGRGGMGIVFEAQHLTMRRRVALKVLPKSSTEKPNYLNRFITEARSAGQLHHTNIVPVFEVGEAEGLHYYTMQFICGDNLDRVIEDVKRLRGKKVEKNAWSQRNQTAISRELAQNLLSTLPEQSAAQLGSAPGALPELPETEEATAIQTREHSGTNVSPGLSNSSSADDLTGSRTSYYRRVAQIGAQIADALAHAHHHGVLHRDVKPGNLILDTDGVAWITDFGLAKAGTDGLTLTGDIIGTLRYMAPERFQGKGDRRSDIYSLGLTLYELCALQSAFMNDHGQLVADVQSRVIRPIREIDQSIPFDLETIIAKTIEHQPENRYKNASDLADDLNRFIHDRPIKARRVSLVEKIVRICRRNPVAASLSACVFALVAMLIAGTLQFAFYKAEQTRNEVSLRKRLQTNLYKAKLDQAQMRLLSQREGQRTLSLQAVREASELLNALEDVHPDYIEQEKTTLRSEAIAALSLTDIEQSWATNFPPGTGSRFRCAMDQTGQRYALGHETGRIDIRRTSDGEIARTLAGANQPNWAMRFDTTGRYFGSVHHPSGAAVKDHELFVWDIANPDQPIFRKKQIRYFVFSPDATKLAIATGNRIEILSLPTGEKLREFSPQFNDPGDPVDRSQTATPKGIKFSSSGLQLAVAEAAGDRVEIWDIENHPKFERSFVCDATVMSFDWDDRRKIMTLGDSKGALHYWRYGESDTPTKLALHQNSIVRIFIHPTKQLVVTYAWDNTNRITDMVAQRELLCVYQGVLMQSGFCSDGRLGFVEQDEMMGLWELSEPVIKAFSVPGRFGGFILFHPVDSGVIGRIVDGFVEFWDIQSETMIGEIPTGETDTTDIQFTPDGTQFVMCGEWGINKRSFRITREDDSCTLTMGAPELISDENTKRILIPHQSNFAGTFFSTHGSTTKRRSLEDGQVLTQFDPLGRLSELSLTADGKHLLGGTWHGRGIRVWDTETGESKHTLLKSEPSATICADPANANRFATYGSRYRIWEFDQTGTPQIVHEGPEFSSRGAFSRDGTRMTAKVNAYRVDYVTPDQNKRLASVESIGPSRIILTSFSPDGNALALGCFDNLQVINLKKLREALQELNLDW